VKASEHAEIIAGGNCDDSKGFFIEPTVVETRDPLFKTMQEEIFGPVLTIYVYPAEGYSKALELCDKTSPYALTGAIFSRDRNAIIEGFSRRHVLWSMPQEIFILTTSRQGP